MEGEGGAEGRLIWRMDVEDQEVGEEENGDGRRRGGS